MKQDLEDVRQYWDSHLNLTQFLPSEVIEIGSDAFWSCLEQSMDRYSYKKQLLERFARDCGGGKLLEVGSGLGLELAQLAALGFEVTGADLAPNAVALCNSYLERRGLPGRAMVQNAESLDFADGEFDAVYSSGVIQHTPRIEKAIEEIWRVTKPGGRILIILYHRHSWFYLLQRLSGTNVEFDSDDAPIINSYTRDEMKRLFGAFTDLEVVPEYYYPKPTQRTGAAAFLYNRIFVPVVGALPESVVRPFGWHLVLTGRK